MADSTTWIDVASGRVFRVPAETELPMGQDVVRNLRGERLDVDLAAMEEHEVSREEAFRHVRDDVGDFLGLLGETLRTEGEKPEPTVRELGDRLKAAVNKGEVADSLDVLGDRLKTFARNLRGGAESAEREPSDQGHKLCPACYGLVVSPGGPCATCGHDLDVEGPVAMSPLEYADADRVDCTACGAPILASARCCEACGAPQ